MRLDIHFDAVQRYYFVRISVTDPPRLVTVPGATIELGRSGHDPRAFHEAMVQHLGAHELPYRFGVRRQPATPSIVVVDAGEGDNDKSGYPWLYKLAGTDGYPWRFRASAVLVMVGIDRLNGAFLEGVELFERTYLEQLLRTARLDRTCAGPGCTRGERASPGGGRLWKCRRCACGRYCSKECQTLDHPHHKKWCRSAPLNSE